MTIDGTLASIPTMDAEQRRQLRANAEKLLVKPAMEANARRVLEALDAQAEVEMAELTSHVLKLPMSQRVVEAFTNEPLTDSERRLVEILLNNPGRSSKELSSALAMGGQSWHMLFGKRCKRREDRLWPAVKSEKRNANFYCGILATWTAEGGWVMKPEVVDGFGGIGLRAKELKPA
jgi:hypothetical protein